MNHRSLAFTLSAWYAVLLSAAFALVGAAMYFGLEHYLRSNLSDTLLRRTQQVQMTLLAAPSPLDTRKLGVMVDTQIAPEFNNRFLRITAYPNSVLYRSGLPNNRSFDPATIATTAQWPREFTTHRELLPGGTALLIAVVPVNKDGTNYLIELGASLDSNEILRDRLLVLLGLLLPTLVILATGGGYILVGRALRPVDEMSHTAEQISLRNLDARLPIPETGDALQRLSVALNSMLHRLRESLQTSQRFLADASHELRTPLTIVKGELEEIVANPQCDTFTADRVGSVLEEVDRLKHLVEGLLVLSRFDAGEGLRESVPVDLGQLVATTADQMRLLAEDGGITLKLTELTAVAVQGDRARIKQVIVNLLDNAVKYTPRGGTVTVRTVRSGRRGLLEVTDTGIGISPSTLPQVFDRFYRADESRTRDGASVGLGLSIVRSICAAHGAEIEVDSVLGAGSRFRVWFPLTQLSVTDTAPALGMLPGDTKAQPFTRNNGTPS